MAIFPATVAQLKELAITGRPLLLARFLMFDGVTTLYCSSNPLNASEGGWQYDGNNYYARLLNQNIPGLQMRSTTGIDQIPSVTLDIADADRTLYRALEQGQGIKGALLTIVLVFFAGNSNAFSSDEWIKFQGVCSKPQFGADGKITVQATATKNLSKTFTPSARFGSRCIWVFPTTLAQRQDAAFNPSSHMFECGYCPDVSGIDPIYGDTVTRGNLIGGVAATSCDLTPAACQANGMYTIDSSARPTGSFGGVQWGPPTAATWSKQYVSGKNIVVSSSRNDSIYNQPIPMVYGTCWTNALPCNFINDANSGRSEVVFSTGQIGEVGGDIAVQGVVANGIWVPRNGQSTDNNLYRWNPANRGSVNAIGTRRGIPTPDAGYNSAGDPYGSLAMIEVVLWSQAVGPNGNSYRVLSSGQKVWAYQPIATISGTLVTLPAGLANQDIAGNPPYTVEILGNSLSAANTNWQLSSWSYGPPGTVTLAGSLSGSGTGGYIRYRTYGIPDGNGVNPAWLMADIMTWSNYQFTDLDAMSFANEAAWCAYQIAFTDITGNANTHSRYKMSCSLEQRRPSDQVVLALLNACNGQLRTDITTGLRQFFIRKTLADQQPSPGLDGSGNYTSNYNIPVVSMHFDGSSGNGYPAYHFNEATLAGAPVELPRDSSQVTNTITFAFQDEENQWSQDSISVSDTDDIARVGGYGAGNEVIENWACEGISNFDQGTRVARVKLAEDIRGNELQDTRGSRIWKAYTNYRVAHLRSGDICLFSWQQWAPGLQPAAGALQSPSGTSIPGILVRILSVEDIGQNFETASVTFRWHEDIWYTDTYGQQPPPVYSDPRKSPPNRAPYAWRGFDVARYADDYLFPSYGFFNFEVNYQQAASGDAVPVATIAGYPIVNQFSTIQPPLLPLLGSAASTGGHIAAGTLIFGVTAVDSSGNESPMSLFCSVTTATGVTTGTNSIPIRMYDPGTISFRLYGGTSELLMTFQGDTLVSGLAGGAIVLTSLQPPAGNPPDVVFDHFHLRGRKVVIPGVWWNDVTYAAVVSSVAKIKINGATAADTWTGYIVSKLCTASGVQPQNYEITAQASDLFSTSENTSVGGNFFVGDIVAIRATGKIVSANTIGDPLFVNAGRSSGLGVNSQVGNKVLIIAGAGAGQERAIVSNTGTTMTLAGAWQTTPDATSVWIVVEPHWLYDTVCASIANLTSGVSDNLIGDIVLENTPGLTIMVQVLTEDVNGNSLHSFYAPFREIYITGNAGALVAATPPFGPNGGIAFPPYGDPLYPQAVFGLVPAYQAKADGSVLVQAQVAPAVPANVFSSFIDIPSLNFPAVATTGGSIAGGQTIYIAIAGVDSGGSFTELSNVITAVIPSGTNTNQVTLAATYSSPTATLLVFAGLNPDILYYRYTISPAASPVLTDVAPVTGNSYGAPDPNFDHFVLGTTKISLDGLGTLGGVQGAPMLVTSYTAITGGATLGVSGGNLAGTLSSSSLNGRILSWVASVAGNQFPIDFTITGITHSGSTITSITVSGPTAPMGWVGGAATLNVGDQVCVRMVATLSGGGAVVTDSLLSMVVNYFAGSVLRMFFSDGSNQTSFIVSNTATAFTVQTPFTGLNPTFFWIEAGSFSAMIPTSPAQIGAYSSSGVPLAAPIDNIPGFYAVQLFASDANGNRSDAGYSPIRDFYWGGNTGTGGASVPVYATVTTTATVAAGVTQVWVDGTSGAYTITIPAINSLSVPIALTRVDTTTNVITVVSAASTIKGASSLLLDNSAKVSVTIFSKAGSTDGKLISFYGAGSGGGGTSYLPIDPRAHGAAADGATDDSVAISTAIGNGGLYLQAGVAYAYTWAGISSAIAAVAAGFTIYGGGTLRLLSGSTPALTFAASVVIKLYDFILDGNMQTGSNAVVQLNSATNIYIRGLLVLGGGSNPGLATSGTCTWNATGCTGIPDQVGVI